MKLITVLSVVVMVSVGIEGQLSEPLREYRRSPLNRSDGLHRKIFALEEVSI